MSANTPVHGADGSGGSASRARRRARSVRRIGGRRRAPVATGALAFGVLGFGCFWCLVLALESVAFGARAFRAAVASPGVALVAVGPNTVGPCSVVARGSSPESTTAKPAHQDASGAGATTAVDGERGTRARDAPTTWPARARRAFDERDAQALRTAWPHVLRDESTAAAALRDELAAFRDTAYATLYEPESRPNRLRDAPVAAALYGDSWAAIYCLCLAIPVACEALDFDTCFELLRWADEVLARAEMDEATRAREGGRVLVERVRVFLRMGLVDRAEVELPKLRAHTDWMLASGAHATVLSNGLVRVANVLIAKRRWAEAEDWIAAELDADHFSGLDRERARYWRALAAFERDRSDEAGVARARDGFGDLVRDDEVTPLVRAQSELRLARIALHRGELDDAARWIAASEATAAERRAIGEPLNVEEEADRSVFEVRLARRTGHGLEAASARLLERWALLLDHWREIPPRPGGVGFLNLRNPQRILGEVLRVRRERDGTRPAFDGLFEAQAASSLPKVLAAAGREPRPPAIGAHELLLVYLPTYEGTHLFAATSEAVEAFWLDEPRDDLIRRIAALNRVVRTPPERDRMERRRAELDALASELWHRLVPSELRERVLATPQLTVCGSDSLQHLPFECLAPDGVPPLGSTHELSYLPSLPLASQLEAGPIEARALEGGSLEREWMEAEAIEKGDADSLANDVVSIVSTAPEDARALSALPSTFALFGGARSIELASDWSRRLTASYGPPWRATHHEGERALPSAVGAAPARVLQLFGHGRLDYGRELMVGVDLDAGRLRYEHVVACAYPPELALLTACGSWRGPLRMGDGGVGHLASAFLRRGTRAIVLPDADVEAEATLVWSEHFHAWLVRGASPARAALEARRALAASADFADPFYHSLLHVVGLGHRPLFEALTDAPPETLPAPARRGAPKWRLALAGAGFALIVFAFARAINRHRRAS